MHLSRRTRPRNARNGGQRSSSDEHDQLTQLYEQHAGSITEYALRRTTGADAADVVADTFMVAWRRVGDIPPEPNTLPWLYGVARRVLANQRRSTRRRTSLHDRLRHEFLEYESVSDRAEVAERFGCVADALAQLSDDDAELLRLTAWEGLTPTQIAAALDIDAAAARQRLHRARTRLRDRIDSGAPKPESQRGPAFVAQLSAVRPPAPDRAVDRLAADGLASEWSAGDAS